MTSSSAEAHQDTTVLSGKVTPDWIERGVLLSKAAWEFGNPGFVNRARAAAERFAELREGETPEMFEGSSLLTGAARDKELLNNLYGAQREAWVEYYTYRDAAQRDIEFRLRFDGTLRAFGQYGTPNREPEWIPVQALIYLHRDPNPTKKDFVAGDDMKYYYVHVVDPGLYSNPPEPSGRSHSGAPGRPTSMHLVQMEMCRRAAGGNMFTTACSDEAKALAAWLRSEHPQEPPLTPKSIQNKLGPLWRELKGKASSSRK